jgi:hypothetical protein
MEAGTADDVEDLVRLNWAQGICKFFITDDNFARSKAWESIFDRLISLRERDGPLGLMIQVDTCHKIPTAFMASPIRQLCRRHSEHVNSSRVSVKGNASFAR